MKTLILFYSYTGHTRAIARQLAEQELADMAEIKDIHRPGRLKAYTGGCLAALKGKAWPIEPLEIDWTVFDRIILLSPVWAGNPPPAANAALAQLPEGKSILVKMISAGGKSNCAERLETVIQGKGSTMVGLEDIRV